MSFFDEAEEPPRQSRRTEPRRRRRSSGGRRPPGDQQAVRTRRAVAALALVVIVILMALGIHSCQVSQRNSALKDYNSEVYNLIQQSNSTGAQLFDLLGTRVSSTDVSNLYTQIGATYTSAETEYNKANSLSVPGEMQNAQEKLLWVLQMRRDGIQLIAKNIQSALSTTDREDAVTQIAAASARFYSSDVLYKSYTLPEIVGALNAAGIPVGGANGQPVNPNQFLTDLGWLEPTFVASKLGVELPASSQSFTPGLHGHILNSVSAGGNLLQAGVTNYVPDSPLPTFTLNLTNGGHFDQFNVECKVSVAGISDVGSTLITETTPGETTTCQVTLPTSPAAGTYNVTAEVVPVRGEVNTADNFMTFPVKFT